MEVENELRLFASANADLLRRRILKAALRDLYHIVLEFEIRQAQLTGLRELRLKGSVEENACAVLTSCDKERAQVVTGVGGRPIIGRDFYFGSAGRNGHIRV